MTNDIDWEAEMEALDASLPERLERAAQMAERSDLWTDTERLMPATGVADLIWEAHSEILGWRALNEERKASRTCPLGEDCDLTVAWMAGRESAKDEVQAMVAAALEKAAHKMDMGWSYDAGNAIRALIPDAGAAIRARAAELKPCPFCGGGADCGWFAGDYDISCGTCQFSISRHISDFGSEKAAMEAAIAAWNTRAAELKEDQ